MDTAVIAVLVLAALLVVIGLAGLFLFPNLPGAPLLYGGIWLAAWAEDFRYLDFWTLAVLLVLTVMAYFGDMISPRRDPDQHATRWRAVTGAVLGGTAAGLLLPDPASILAGLFVGALLAELTIRRGMTGFHRLMFGSPNGLLEKFILNVLSMIIRIGLVVTMASIALVNRF